MASLSIDFARRMVRPIFERAGVHINGSSPWDLQVHDEQFYVRTLSHGSLGMGESYMDGDWDCAQLDELIARLLGSAVDDGVFDWRKKLLLIQGQLINLQTKVRAGQVAEVHYDLGNEFFEEMLGPTMNYSCGYWRNASDLDSAQEAKMDLICRKLQLKKGERLLDIGSGWGGLGRFAAERYGCEVVGITISAPQQEYATAHAGALPVRYLLSDYRNPKLAALGPFDKLVSVGMFEHVGRRNYREFLRIARGLLKEEGLFLLHTIANDHSATDTWLNRYIFPNGELPALTDMAQAVRGQFVMEDWHNFRSDYDRTIMAWLDNLTRSKSAQTLSPRFRRMWHFYLSAMTGCFRAQTRNQLWQLVLSPRGVPGGYLSIR